MRQLPNPMSFCCAPNAATPDYVAYTEFRLWVAYGLWVCWIGDPHSDDPNCGHEDIRELRSYFLDLVETVIVAIWKGECAPDEVDVGDSQTLIIEDEVNPGVREAWLTWCVRLGKEAMMFELVGPDQDSYSIWLSYSAIEDRKSVLATLQEARKTLDCTDYRGEVWSELIQQVG